MGYRVARYAVAVFGLAVLAFVVLFVRTAHELAGGVPAAAATVVAAGGSATPGGTPPEGMPLVSYDAIRWAAQAKKPAGCDIDWTLVGGVAKVETGWGTYGGARPDNAGNLAPMIRGINLNGQGAAAGFAVIEDTDGGRLDGYADGDAALGMAQVMPGTLGGMIDRGEVPATINPQNVYDAAWLATVKLCNDGNLYPQTTGRRKAVLAYNYDTGYLADVNAATAELEAWVDSTPPRGPVGGAAAGGPGPAATRKATFVDVLNAMRGKTFRTWANIGVAVDGTGDTQFKAAWSYVDPAARVLFEPPAAGAPTTTGPPGGGAGTFRLPVEPQLLENVDGASALLRRHHDYPAWDSHGPGTGDEALAVTAGVVGYVDAGGACGNGVVLVDQDQNEYAYCHLSAFKVREGDRVGAGQVLGLVGSTGNSDGPHLHLGIRLADGTQICPQPLLVDWAAGIGTRPQDKAVTEGCAGSGVMNIPVPGPARL